MSLAAPDALPALRWGDWSTRYLFFTGKGGVGKTTTASAVAIALGDAGKRTLVISTDPASNLDDLFGIDASLEPTPVPGVGGLFVSNLDPEAAALAFKERAVAPYRGVLPESALRNMEELAGACTVEIAAFNEFTAVLAAPQDTAEFDHVIFDTAPTGHTLRLIVNGRLRDPEDDAMALAFAGRQSGALAGATPDGLLVERIDPAVETARYTQEVLAAATGLDEPSHDPGPRPSAPT